ncbi:MAG: PD-(D/E)XK nuclease family protein [Candidatus Sericytochromatia bacterium]
MIRKISSTQFLEYKICPLSYYYKYVKGFNKIPFDTKEDTQIGKDIHKIIELFAKGNKIPENYINQNKLIKDAFDYYVEKYHVENENIKNEFEFNLPIFIENKKIFLVGRIDQLIIEKDKATIIDWKTGEKFTKASNIKNFLQLNFYAYVIHKFFNISNIELKLVYLSAKKEFSKNIELEKLLVIEEEIKDMIKNTYTEKVNYIPNPINIDKDIPFCKICNFLEFCDKYI